MANKFVDENAVLAKFFKHFSTAIDFEQQLLAFLMEALPKLSDWESTLKQGGPLK